MDRNNNNQNDMSGQQMFVGGGVVILLGGGMWVDQNPQKVEQIWFQFYEAAHMAGLGLIGLLAIGIIYFINKKTKKLKERAHRLEPMMNKHRQGGGRR